MSARMLVAAAGGACVAFAIDGTAAVLTAEPRAVVLLTGGALIAVALRGMRGLAAASIGALLGFAMPPDAPPAPGKVQTRAVEAGVSGDLFALLDTLDRNPASVIGRRVSVSGEWTPAAGAAQATVSRRIMSCCAADAVAVGFDVVAASPVHVSGGAWVRVDGILQEHIVSGDLRFSLEHARISDLEDSAPLHHTTRN